MSSTPTASEGLSPQPPSSASSSALVVGSLVAERYRIERTLGEGGMGVVYLAEHVAMRKAVALKVLHAEGSRNTEIVQRFEREAVAAASIDHQHVASATDFGALPDGSFYLVLEFVPGRSLRDVVSEGPLEPARALGILRGVVAGVAAAHARGIVHRDLKPENVMLTERDGNTDFVKVLDFGIAKLGMEAEPSGPASRPLTRVGTIMGTPNYMSPEQAVGQPCDARADVYALGVVFYEMLVGEPLFDGDPVLVLAAHVTSPPPPLPASVQEALGPRGDEVLQKMLAKSPDDRFQTAVELQAALQELGAQGSPAPGSVIAASSVVVAATPHTAQAVTAPTMALSTSAATMLASSAAPTQSPIAASDASDTRALAAPEGLPEDRSRRMVLGAALAAGATGMLILLVLALRGPAVAPDDVAASGASGVASAAGAERLLLPSAHPSHAAPAASIPMPEEPDAGAKTGNGKAGGKKKGKDGFVDKVVKPFGKLF